MSNFNYLSMDAYAKSRTKSYVEKEFKDYVSNDILMENYMNNLLNSGYINSKKNQFLPYVMPQIKDVKFNGPATIVFFDDNTKVVIKCTDTDIFDPEKAVMICVLRKALGMSSSQFKKWIGNWTKAYEEPTETWNSIEEICQAFKNVFHI